MSEAVSEAVPEGKDAKFNFSAGPANLPETVIEQIRQDLPNWKGTGFSVMELSHRGTAFMEFAADCEARLRRLANISDEYAVLFLQGGATQQFAQTYQNLAEGGKPAFVVNGHWGRKARAVAERLGSVQTVAECEPVSVPEIDAGAVPQACPYLHITTNETVDGVQFSDYPDCAIPLVADMSSDFLSRPLDINQFGLIYASAQKNLGPAGLTLVIVRRHLMGKAAAELPDLARYERQAAADSMLNTPPTFVWYVTDLVLRWIETQGGLEAMQVRNAAKAARLYRYLDQTDFYTTRVERSSRSVMNVTFQLADASLQQTFLARSEAAGFIGLKGHRVVGGLRASLYNAIPESWVVALCDFLGDFEQRYG